MQSTRLWVVVGLAIAAGCAVAASAGRRVDSYSCSGCRNLKQVDVRSICGIDVHATSRSRSNTRRRPTINTTGGSMRADVECGPQGILGKMVDCQPYRYRDGRGPGELAVHQAGAR